MADLISRLSEAKEGSRELSDEVLVACGWVSFRTGWREHKFGMLYTHDRPNPSVSIDNAPDLDEPEGFGNG